MTKTGEGEGWLSFQVNSLGWLQWLEVNPGRKLMEDKSISDFGKKIGKPREEEMTSAALSEAIMWNERLLDAEFRGRKDKEYLARSRLAERLGVKDSYLFRLQYKTEEMKDVAGSVYRALMHAYNDLCSGNEEAAAAYREERLELRKQHEADQELHQTAMGRVSSQAGTTKAPKTTE